MPGLGRVVLTLGSMWIVGNRVRDVLHTQHRRRNASDFPVERAPIAGALITDLVLRGRDLRIGLADVRQNGLVYDGAIILRGVWSARSFDAASPEETPDLESNVIIHSASWSSTGLALVTDRDGAQAEFRIDFRACIDELRPSLAHTVAAWLGADAAPVEIHDARCSMATLAGTR